MTRKVKGGCPISGSVYINICTEQFCCCFFFFVCNQWYNRRLMLDVLLSVLTA